MKCPECDFEPPIDFPDDRYIVEKGKIKILKQFWRKVKGEIGSYEANPLFVVDQCVFDKDRGFNKIIKYEHRFYKKPVYPRFIDMHQCYDYYSGVSYSAWNEVHCCPFHGEFQFDNATA
jgi:hypothetical protein